MDPLSTLLIALLGALTGAIGATWAARRSAIATMKAAAMHEQAMRDAALENRAAAEQAATIQAEAAKEIAREQDRRQWRKAQVRGFLRHANQRLGLYLDLVAAINNSRWDEALSLSDRIWRRDSIFNDITHQAVGHSGFRDSMAAFLLADNALYECIPAILKKRLSLPPSEFQKELGNLISAVTQLNRAAEQYIYDS